MTIPITMMDVRSSTGLPLYPVNKQHKFSTSIASYPEERYYPMNSYSYNDMASMIGVVKRVAGTPSLSASGGDAFILSTDELTTGTPWVGSARTFATIVALPAGATVNYDLRVSCSDPSVADNVTAFVYEDRMEGAVGNLPPTWSVMAMDSDGVGANYGFITNYGSAPAIICRGLVLSILVVMRRS